MNPRDATRIEDGHDAQSDADLPALRDRLHALARAEARREASAHIEAAVLRAWDAAHPKPERARISWRRWAAAAAVVATVSAGAAISLRRASVVHETARPAIPGSDVHLAADTPAPAEVAAAPMPPPRITPPRTVARTPVERPAATTLVLVGTPVMTGERVRVVRMRVARQTLLEMGLRPIVQDDATSVDVEMLVGEDGVARGLRVRM